MRKQQKWGRRASDNQAYPKISKDATDLPNLEYPPATKPWKMMLHGEEMEADEHLKHIARRRKVVHIDGIQFITFDLKIKNPDFAMVEWEFEDFDGNAIDPMDAYFVYDAKKNIIFALNNTDAYALDGHEAITYLTRDKNQWNYIYFTVYKERINAYGGTYGAEPKLDYFNMYIFLEYIKNKGLVEDVDKFNLFWMGKGFNDLPGKWREEPVRIEATLPSAMRRVKEKFKVVPKSTSFGDFVAP